MDIRDITAENVAKAVGGTVERDGSILCRCPVHEASGTHNPSLLLSITDDAPHPVSLPVAELRRQAFPGHPRPSGRKMRPAAIACRRQPCGQRDPLHLSTPRRKLCLDQDQVRHEIGKEAFPLRGVGRDHQTMVERQTGGDAAPVQSGGDRQRPRRVPGNTPADRRGREGRQHGGRTRRARHHQRRRRRQVARRGHANTDQAGSAQGRRLPRQRWPRHRARHPRRQDVPAGEHRGALAGAARARPQGGPLGLGAEAGAARRAAQRADRRGTAVRRRGARLAQPPEDGAAATPAAAIAATFPTCRWRSDTNRASRAALPGTTSATGSRWSARRRGA